jgi:hypothetical protein
MTFGGLKVDDRLSTGNSGEGKPEQSGYGRRWQLTTCEPLKAVKHRQC